MKTIIIITLLALFGTKGQAQPLLKTHVETPNKERIKLIDDFMKYIRSLRD